MYVITERNVHSVLPLAVDLLLREGVERPSRNGPVLTLTAPVTTLYLRPQERVMLWPERDANPFFHLLESLWMLAGRRDVKFVSDLVPGMKNFSDDGAIFNAAYGYRWRHHFGEDQLLWAIDELKRDPSTRRVVIGIWDGAREPAAMREGSKDLPCNLAVHLQIGHDGRLDMTVFNRSNDIVWGAYGANAVHFSMLQEFVARAIGVEVGRYWQVSDNWHGYLKTLEPVKSLAEQAEWMGDRMTNPYELEGMKPFPLISTPVDEWLLDNDIFLTEGNVVGLRDPFFRRVAGPMASAYRAFKKFSGDEKYDIPLEILDQCTMCDWKVAGVQWLERRKIKYLTAKDDGVAHE